ncbi:MAG: response regulator, partial [Pseudomonadota bacterium]
GNAIKFTDSGEVCLRVRGHQDQQRDWLEIAVSDSGIGIPVSRLGGVFDAFTQADASTTRRFGGTGLGLSISRDLVRLMGGDITVTSDLGQGSTFRFTADLGVIEPSREPGYRGLAGKRVLAVDDNATNRAVLGSYLERLAIEHEVVESPEALLNRAAEPLGWDLFIVDMHMPGMDGAMLARELRSRTSGTSRPPRILLLSSLGDGEADSHLFDCTFTKPVRPKLLADALSTLFLAHPTSTDHQAPAATASEVFTYRVLVAEDNPVNQKVAIGLLGKLGVQPDVVSNGREVLQMLTQQRYDVVLMDVQMPEVDGLEATRLIRESDALAQPHIIAMTANAMAQDREQCLEVGMDDFLSKPVRLSGLTDVLARAALSRRVNTEAANG